MTAAADSIRHRAFDRLSVLLLAGTAAMLAVDVWVVATVPLRAPFSTVVREAVFAGAWIVVGVVALWLGRDLLARRILTLAFVLVADAVGSFGLREDDFPLRLLVTLTAILVPLQIPVAGHLLIAYPSGRVSDPFGRRLVVWAYVLGAAQSIWWAFAHASTTSCATCAKSLTLLPLPPEIDRVVSAVFSVAWVLFCVAVVVLLVSRYRRAGPRQRRMLRLPYASIVVAAGLYAVMSIAAAATGTSSVWMVSIEAQIALQIVALLSVPLCFLIALIQERLAYRPVGDLVVKLANGSSEDLEHALASALRDPQLSLSFPIDGGFVDMRGRPVAAPAPDDRSTVTTVGESDAPLVLVRHDRSLSDEPALLTAAGSATRLALENARLHAEVRAQLREVRESRTRIVAATDAARARIERDLHDGAQQRLLAVGLALQLFRQNPDDGTLLDAAESELRNALAELRELAAGIHPAALTDLGLIPALRALAERLGSRVRLDAPASIKRCPLEVETAAYFSTSEAITNALKHAAPSAVQVTVGERDQRVIIKVHDDGPGGADSTGSGLVGVRDRLASVDGSLTIVSPLGGGTDVTLEVPCA
ncbi:histidine kinase [Microbacterium sp. SS28]|uniref:sensor histidine kinase n=1 Tax=Microbacterium sp. SS28 TaxID=2919948 RepID=UPI001FAB27F2|nr:histidine kinase [Microbacterium sp. SS28]